MLSIRLAAAQFGKTEAEFRSVMRKSLDDTWEKSRSDPELKIIWDFYFPNGKPSVEEFFVHLATVSGYGEENSENDPLTFS